MEILLQRYSDNKESTQGLLFVDKKFFCFILEDEHRDVKVMSETRIPSGLYELKIQRSDTPLTVKHRADYNKTEVWFKYHIEVTGIPNFSGVYVHAGNTDDHTAGCLLPADTQGNNQIEEGRQERSIQATKRFYHKVYPALEKGQRVYLKVQDESKLFD